MLTVKTSAQRVATTIASSKGCVANLRAGCGSYQPTARTTSTTKRSIRLRSSLTRFSASTHTNTRSSNLSVEPLLPHQRTTDSNRGSPLIISCSSFTTTTTNSDNASSSRPDPFARRPNQKCDPYGQGGKPLSLVDAKRLLATVDSEWKLDMPEEEGKETRTNNDDGIVPTSISREFYHDEFIDGSTLITKIAALSQINNHYPTIKLQRQVVKKLKQWRAVTTITCHTKVLKGLSHHDFHLAMLIDVEIERPENKRLWIGQT